MILIVEKSGIFINAELFVDDVFFIDFMEDHLGRVHGNLKVFSAGLSNHSLFEEVAQSFGGEVHVSQFTFVLFHNFSMIEQKASGWNSEVFGSIKVNDSSIGRTKIAEDGSQVSFFSHDEWIGIDSRDLFDLEDKPVHHRQELFSITVKKGTV